MIKKRSLVLSFILMVLIGTSMTFADGKIVPAKIPTYDICFNGAYVDNVHSDYPMIEYNGITYIPLTSDYLLSSGVYSYWDDSTGLSLDSKGIPRIFRQSFRNSSNQLGSALNATVANFSITINDQQIDNSTQTYPILSYKNITYIPLTWDLAVNKLNITATWGNIEGLTITSSDNNGDPITTEKISTDLIEGTFENLQYRLPDRFVLWEDKEYQQYASVGGFVNIFSMDVSEYSKTNVDVFIQSGTKQNFIDYFNTNGMYDSFETAFAKSYDNVNISNNLAGKGILTKNDGTKQSYNVMEFYLTDYNELYTVRLEIESEEWIAGNYQYDDIVKSLNLINTTAKATPYQPSIEKTTYQPKKNTSNVTGLYYDGTNHWINKTIEGGSYIELEDYSLWKVTPFETYNSILWLPIDDITIIYTGEYANYPYELINTTDGELVHAKLVSN